ETYMRGMGDIDLLVRKEQFEAAKTLLESNGYHLEEATSHHHVYKALDKNTIELHQSIASINDFENIELLKHVWSYTNKVSDYEYKLIPEFEYAYLLLHLARHMRTSGVGIRSLLDIDVYSNHFKKLDFKLTNEFLTKTNIVVFE